MVDKKRQFVHGFMGNMLVELWGINISIQTQLNTYGINKVAKSSTLT